MVDLPLEGLWVSLSELAAQRGTSPQAASKRVRRLVKLGALTTRPGPNGAKLVNLAAFDAAIASTGDAINTANGGGRHGPATPQADDDDPAARDPVLAKEQARRTAYQADIAKLDLERKRGNLWDAAMVRQGVAEAGEKVKRDYLGFASQLRDIVALANRDGLPAAEAFVRKLGVDAALALARTVELRAAEIEEGAT